MIQFSRLTGGNRLPTLFVSAAALVLAACSGDDTVASSSTTPPDPPKPSELAISMKSSMDPSADPCQDFYRYACGGWLDTTTLRADETARTRSFSMAGDANESRLDTLMQRAVDDPGSDPAKIRVGTYFGACIDEAAIDAAGTAPLEPYFADIDATTDTASVMGLIGRLHESMVSALFALTTFVLPDGLTAIIVDQAPLSLGEKDAYSRQDAQSVSIRDAFVAHVGKMLELAGDAPAVAQAGAQKVLALETALANASMTPAEHRNIIALYHPMDYATLKQTNPGIPWDPYFEALGVPNPTGTINVAVLEYFTALEALLSRTPKEDLRAYLRWTVMNLDTLQLPKAFRDADFDFYGRTLNGQAEPQSRRKICAGATRGAVPDSVGKAYVDEYFPGDNREVATTMMAAIEETFRSGLADLTWLDDATRQWVTDKSLATANQIGYPDVWEAYDGLTLSPDNPYENARAAGRFAVHKVLSLFGKPADRVAWAWDSATVNAQSRVNINALNFPAGILQPPFYSREFPLAVNHGAIGAVMGHELTHGFDDQGRIFGADGVPGQYWSDPAVAAFGERTACVKDQFDAYEVQPGLNVDGALTLGENIADLGGVRLSFRTFQRLKKATKTPAAPLMEGMTDEQAFFVAYGQIWCRTSTPEAARNQVLTDPHSPGKFRVIGPLSNTPEFAEAFACKPGDTMVRENPCEVW